MFFLLHLQALSNACKIIIMTIFLIWLICALLYHNKQPVKEKGNPYINRHRLKLSNDRNYSIYEKWCLKNGHIPMNKQVFILEIEDKENYINNLINGNT